MKTLNLNNIVIWISEKFEQTKSILFSKLKIIPVLSKINQQEYYQIELNDTHKPKFTIPMSNPTCIHETKYKYDV